MSSLTRSILQHIAINGLGLERMQRGSEVRLRETGLRLGEAIKITAIAIKV